MALLFKRRDKPPELIYYELLEQRIPFNKEEKKNYFNVRQGYEGEILFDQLSQKYVGSFAVFNDLLLKVNNTLFQVDSLMVTGDAAHLFEIKNAYGEHFYEQGRLYSISGKEKTNPLIQLKRSESLLRQLFQHLHFPLPIKAHVIFIHPEFTLFQAPKKTPFILPTQFPSFMKHFAQFSSFPNAHQTFANKLLSMHQTENPYAKIPSYQYENLKKGIKCCACNNLVVNTKERDFVCHYCGHDEKFDAGIVRSVQELKDLFPEKKITTNLLLDWCQLDCDKKRVQRVLSKFFKKAGSTRGTYYE